MALTAPPAAPPAAPVAPGDAPSRANPSTFRGLADAFVTWLVGFRTSMADLRAWLAEFRDFLDTHVTEVNALIPNIEGAADAATAAVDAQAAAEAARDASIAIILPRQKFMGPGPWTITTGTVHSHLWSFIGGVFYDASEFSQVGQVISGVTTPRVASNQPVVHFYI